jgi:hypothetical protein
MSKTRLRTNLLAKIPAQRMAHLKVHKVNHQIPNHRRRTKDPAWVWRLKINPVAHLEVEVAGTMTTTTPMAMTTVEDGMVVG